MKQQKSRKTPIKALLALAIIVVFVAGFLIYKHNQTPKVTVQLSAKQNVAQPPKNPAVTASSSTPKPNANVPGGSTGSTVTSTAQLTEPTGTFVSNHGSANQPVSSGSVEASSCTTTPGASCDIQFSGYGVTKDLGSKVTSTSSGNLPAGSVSWQWTPASIGLSSGVWKITAVATLNSQTKTANDQLNLTVQ
jgi:hypothetical protein